MLLPTHVASYGSTPACTLSSSLSNACLASSHPWYVPMIGRVKECRFDLLLDCTFIVQQVMCYDCHPEGCLVNSLPVTHSSPCVSTGKTMNVIMSKERLYTVCTVQYISSSTGLERSLVLPREAAGICCFHVTLC